eukprot:7052542-Pyramimonas_sp.AAC.1
MQSLSADGPRRALWTGPPQAGANWHHGKRARTTTPTRARATRGRATTTRTSTTSRSKVEAAPLGWARHDELAHALAEVRIGGHGLHLGIGSPPLLEDLGTGAPLLRK